MSSLTRGCIAQMKSGVKPPSPIVQVLSIKAVVTAGAGSTGPTRYRVLLMDGADHISAMSATQLNDKILDGTIKDFSVIQLTNYMINEVNGMKMCILLQFDVIEHLDAQIPGLHVDSDGYTSKPGGTGGNMPPAHYQAAPAYSAPPAAPVASSYGSYGAPAATAAYGAPAQPKYQAPATNPYSSSAYGSSYGGIAAAPAANNRPVFRDDSSVSIIPISAINPYSNRWTIKARITAKSDIKRWSNAKGEGTLFSVDLLDSQGGEIRGTFFKEACDKFFGGLEEGKVYTFSGAVTKVVQNRQFSNIKNQYELTFNVNSEIHPASDDNAIKAQHFDFVKIDRIATMEAGGTIDVIGIVRSFTEMSEIVSQKMGGKVLQKRDLTLVDDTFNEIRCTLWGDKAAQDYEWHTLPIVAIKGVKIGDYQGRTLSTGHSSVIVINPQSPEGHALNNFRSAYPDGQIPVSGSLSNQGGGGGGSQDALEKRRSIQSIKDDGLGLGEKPDYVTVKGSVSYIKHDTDCWYTACPTPNCNKKVLEGMSGQWSCEKCNLTFPDCHRRYILSMTMSDHSGNSFFSLFNESAEKLLGHTAQELYEMKMNGNELGYDEVFSNALFKTLVCRVRVKQEQVNDEMRVKCTVATMAPLDLVSECKQMIDAINKYAQ